MKIEEIGEVREESKRNHRMTLLYSGRVKEKRAGRVKERRVKA